MMITRRALIPALFLLALSGPVFHSRIHNFMVKDPLDPGIAHCNRTLFLASLFPLIDLVLVTALFMRNWTSAYDYLLNGIIVIYGTVIMARFSIAGLTVKSAPLGDRFLKSTLPDSGIAWSDV